MSFGRMVPFILVNIVVSAVVVILILTFWGRNNPSQASIIPTVTAQAVRIQQLQANAIAQPIVDEGFVDPVASAPTAAPSGNADSAESSADGPVFHTVLAGELLGSISVEYDVAVDDIVEANGLDNPNQIFVGQELLIPVGGIVAAQPEVVEEEVVEESAEPTPVPTEAVSLGESTIEITNVDGVGNAQSEKVEITNTGANTVDLTGWTIGDDSGGLVYTFNDVRLFGGGAAITLHSRTDQDSITDYFWGQINPVWSSGTTVNLRDADGNIQSSFTVP